MLSILDAFSGCGGFSLGAHQAGFETALAIDADDILSSSFKLNFPKSKLLIQDIRKVEIADVNAAAPNGIDGVIGGPPCQAFSEMGRRAVDDPRRDLVLEFFRIVNVAKPKFFLFENVRGLSFESNIGLLNAGLETLPASWKIYGPHILNAADFGAATRRLRLFVFGFNTNEMNLPKETELTKKCETSVSVRDAIADLASASLTGEDEAGYDLWKYDGRRSRSAYAISMRTQNGIFTGHKKTQHTKKTLKRFATLEPRKSDKIGKYVRLSWDGLCPTLRAGTGRDRGSYQAVRPVHPELDRVITPREAARLQGFPDEFLLHPTVWHSCRMVGNSVSPIVAKVLLQRIAEALKSSNASASIAAE